MNKPTETQGRKFARRDFLRATSVAGAGALFAASSPRIVALAAGGKTRFAIVGVGIRSQMYQVAVNETYREHAEMAAYCDVNEGRLRLAQEKAKAATGRTMPVYDAHQFDRMVSETRPDVVIVTTVDSTHHQYIVRAMELGCDVITEKPLTVDQYKCQQIIDAQKKTGRRCRVTFNYRYSPPCTQVKDLVMSGAIGDVLSVDFHWLLNTHHGADYFRRWHSQKELSGGLMVHKATHHFDLVNWWLSAVPVSVLGEGKREFYTPAMARRFGLASHHERCSTCPEKQKCAFELNLAANRTLKALYLDHEQHDGYFRDRCVFRPEINIEDTMNVIVRYDTNATMSYSLNAFNSWEGYAIAFNGAKGRLEHQVVEQVYVSGTDTVQGGIREGGITTRLIPLRGPAQEIEPWTGVGGHGGGDAVMLDDLFLPNRPLDKYLRAADHRAGAYSALTGVAANISFLSGQAVRIEDLVKGVAYPDYPPMPTRRDVVPMPAKLARV